MLEREKKSARLLTTTGSLINEIVILASEKKYLQAFKYILILEYKLSTYSVPRFFSPIPLNKTKTFEFLCQALEIMLILDG